MRAIWEELRLWWSSRDPSGTVPSQMMRDTSLSQQNDYYARLARLTPEQRLRIAASLSAGVRRLAEAGIRQRHPEATADEVRVRLTVRLYGRGAGRRLFGAGAVPSDAI